MAVCYKPHMTQPADTPNEWLSIAQAAAYSGYSQHHLRDLVAAGDLPAVQRAPRQQYRIRRADLDAWIAGATVFTN